MGSASTPGTVLTAVKRERERLIDSNIQGQGQEAHGTSFMDPSIVALSFLFFVLDTRLQDVLF